MTELRLRFTSPVLAMLLLAGCGGEPPTRPVAGPTQPPAEQVIDGITIRASAVATAGLGAPITARYGVDDDRGTVLLLVTVTRADADGTETTVPARVRATRVDLLDRRTPIALREVHDGERVEFAGGTHAEIPDTLRFEVTVERAGALPATLRFHRDFF